MRRLETFRSNVHLPVVGLIVAILVGYAIITLSGWTAAEKPAEQAEHAVVDAVSHYWAVIPFTLLLGAIAVLPLLEQTAHWWERNLNKLYVAVVLAIIVLMYLSFLHPRGSLALAVETLEHVVIQDYIPFIILLFSLYTISGGIRIAGDLPAHSLTNVSFIGAGGLLASFIGTTGAAMLLESAPSAGKPNADAA